VTAIQQTGYRVAVHRDGSRTAASITDLRVHPATPQVVAVRHVAPGPWLATAYRRGEERMEGEPDERGVWRWWLPTGAPARAAGDEERARWLLAALTTVLRADTGDGRRDYRLGEDGDVLPGG